jgi:hypothetical protein
MSVVVHFTNREPLSVEAADAARHDNALFIVTSRRSSRAIALFDARDVVHAHVFRDGRLAEIVVGLGVDGADDARSTVR